MIGRILQYRGVVAVLQALLLLLSPVAPREALASSSAHVAVETDAVVCESDECCEDVSVSQEADQASDAAQGGDCNDCGDTCTQSCPCCASAALTVPTLRIERFAAEIARLNPMSMSLYAAADSLPFDRPPR